MYHPTSRVLIVLELLQSHERMSGPELATRLEVDTRTIRHYITLLQDIGVPVEAVIGRYGGYRLRPGFKLPPLMFNNDEALALTLGLLVAQKMGVAAITPTAEGALAKLERVLPVSLRQQVQALQETLVVAMAPSDVLVERFVVETTSSATLLGRRVRLRYRTGSDRETERAFDPYGVACHQGRWYTAGYCHLRHELRVLRLDRIMRIEMQSETFTRPAEFDILAHLIQSFVAIPDRWQVEVVLKAPLEEVQRKVPASLATLMLEPQEQGVVFSASIHDLTWMARFLVGLGSPFSIRQPAELRTALYELGQEIIRLAQEDMPAFSTVGSLT